MGVSFVFCVCAVDHYLTEFLTRLLVRSKYIFTHLAQKSQVESCSCRISVAGGPNTSLDFCRVCLW